MYVWLVFFFFHYWCYYPHTPIGWVVFCMKDFKLIVPNTYLHYIAQYLNELHVSTLHLMTLLYTELKTSLPPLESQSPSWRWKGADEKSSGEWGGSRMGGGDSLSADGNYNSCSLSDRGRRKEGVGKCCEVRSFR